MSNTIEMRLDNVSQIFETKDPFSFRERELATDADAYISGRAGEMPHDQEFELVIHLPSKAASLDAVETLGTSVSNYFAHRADVVARERSELFRVGRRALAIGLFTLVAALVAGSALSSLDVRGYFAHYFEEGLVILGWVALWRPLEIFLYDWWPLARQRKLYQRLSEARVSIMFYEPADAAEKMPVAPGRSIGPESGSRLQEKSDATTMR